MSGTQKKKNENNEAGEDPVLFLMPRKLLS